MVFQIPILHLHVHIICFELKYMSQVLNCTIFESKLLIWFSLSLYLTIFYKKLYVKYSCIWKFYLYLSFQILLHWCYMSIMVSHIMSNSTVYSTAWYSQLQSMTIGFLSQRASNAISVFMLWRHHVLWVSELRQASVKRPYSRKQ